MTDMKDLFQLALSDIPRTAEPASSAEDPLGSDATALHASRERLLAVATVIVPGHGGVFRPGDSTPR